MPVRPLLLVWILALGGARVAGASPFEDPVAGGAVFTGPTQAHATGVFLNPAALTMLREGHQVFVGASAQLDRYGISRLRLTDPDGDLEPAGHVTATTLSPTGMFAYINTSDHVAWGLSLGLPQRHDFIDDADALSYHTLGGHLYQVAPLSVSVATRVGRYAGGVTLSVSTSSWLELDFARDTALEAGSGAERGVASDCGGGPCGIENPRATQIYQLKANTDYIEPRNTVLTIGGMMALAHGWWVGASYQGPPGFYTPLRLTGEVRVSEAPRDGAVVRRGDAEVVYDPPQTFRAGARGPVVPGLEAVLSARYHHLSRMNRLDIFMFGGNLAPADVPEWYPRYLGFRDSVAVAAGLEQTAARVLRLAGRVRLESGAVDDRRISPLFVSGWNVGGSAGAELRLGGSFILAASYGLTWYPTRGSRDSAFDPRDRLACVDSGYDLDACAPARQGRALPSAAGTYSRIGHALSVSLRWEDL